MRTMYRNNIDVSQMMTTKSEMVSTFIRMPTQVNSKIGSKAPSVSNKDRLGITLAQKQMKLHSGVQTSGNSTQYCTKNATPRRGLNPVYSSKNKKWESNQVTIAVTPKNNSQIIMNTENMDGSDGEQDQREWESKRTLSII